MKSATEDKEKLIGYLFMGGGGCFVVGLIVTALAVLTGASILYAIGPFSVVVAICLAVGGFYMGMDHNKLMNTGATRPPEEGRIIARFAINEIGEMIFDNFDYDAEGAKYYVRVQYLGGKRDELETARPVFDSCGEGMRGLLTIQGGWLAQFAPLLDTPETRAAYKDW